MNDHEDELYFCLVCSTPVGSYGCGCGLAPKSPVRAFDGTPDQYLDHLFFPTLVAKPKERP